MVRRQTVLVVGKTRSDAWRRAVRVNRYLSVHRALTVEHIPDPYQNRAGSWVVWLDYVLPVAEKPLGVGQQVDLGRFSPAPAA